MQSLRRMLWMDCQTKKPDLLPEFDGKKEKPSAGYVKVFREIRIDRNIKVRNSYDYKKQAIR